jgi:hypothetical protein
MCNKCVANTGKRWNRYLNAVVIIIQLLPMEL